MLKANSLVLYKKQPAVVSGVSDGKYTIDYCTSSTRNEKKVEYGTQKVREKDIVELYGGPVRKEQLMTLQCDVDEQTAVDIVSPLHELLGDDDSFPDGVPFREMCDFAGIQTPEDYWKLYLALQKTVYFDQTQTDDLVFQARTLEQIAAIKEKNETRDKEAQARKDFIERVRRRRLDLPTDAQLVQDIEALALGSSDKSRTMKEAGIPETAEQAHRFLLDTGVWDTHRNPYPIRFGLSAHSATEHLASPPHEDRVILSHVAYAIDNAWSTDPDDAIAFDGTYVWVHIADPASSVEPDSSIDISARNRGATLYIPEGASRMLAEKSLEDYALGLVDGLSKALSFKITLDKDGAVLCCDVQKTLVKVQRLTYEEADNMLDTPELAPLYDIARRNALRREKAGAVSITLPEVHISVLNDTVNISPVVETESANLVKEFMLLAGEAAAKFAFKNAIPFPYVSQEKPDIPKELPDKLAGQYRLRRCMRSRSIGITPMQHAGLGLGMYSQVTSPLRRYSDLVAHQQIRAFIDGKPLLSKEQMLERIAAGDIAASAATRAERKSNYHWTLVYLDENPSWTGEAVIVELKGNQAICLVPSLGLETTIVQPRTMKLNDRINVRAGNINIPALSVSFREL